MSGRSSVVEHNLAKVGVESSNLFARSNFSWKIGVTKSALRGRLENLDQRVRLVIDTTGVSDIPAIDFASAGAT